MAYSVGPDGSWRVSIEQLIKFVAQATPHPQRLECLSGPCAAPLEAEQFRRAALLVTRQSQRQRLPAVKPSASRDLIPGGQH